LYRKLPRPTGGRNGDRHKPRKKSSSTEGVGHTFASRDQGGKDRAGSCGNPPKKKICTAGGGKRRVRAPEACEFYTVEER